MNIPHKKEEIGFDSDGKVTNCFDVVIPLDTMKEVCKDILQIQVNDDDILADRAQVEVPEGISPGSELLIEIPMGPLAERAILDSHREYDSLTFSQLSALCAQRGLRAFSASKQTLIKRLTLNDKTKFRKDSKDSESFRKLIQNSKLDQRPPRKVLRVIPRSRLDMGDLSPEFCTSAKYEMELTTKALAAMCNRYEIPHHGCTKQKMAKLLMGWKTQVDNELSDLCLLLKTGQIYCLSTHQHFDVDPENLAIAKKLLSSDISVMDLDERGTIDAEELKTILNQTFLDRHTVVSKETCNILINMVDSIGNGTIDQFEYSGLQNQLRNWKKDFDSYDQEKSGFVHYDEVNSMCTIAGYYFSPGFYVLLERSHVS